MPNGHNEATRLLRVIDGMVEKKTKSGANIDQTYGQVFELSGRTASVYLAGSRELAESDGGVPEPSEGYRVPSWMKLNPDDFVRVSIDARGHRWIDEYLTPPDEEIEIPPTSMLGANVARFGEIILGSGPTYQIIPTLPKVTIDFKTGQISTTSSLGTSGPLILPRSGNQGLVAATPVLANASHVQVNTSGAVVTTAAPTIADGVDGQLLVIVYAGTGSWQIRDQGTLAGSNVRLATSTYTMTDRDVLVLMWTSTTSNWVEVGRSKSAGGSALTVKDEGSTLATDASTLDFVGPGVTASGTGAVKTITIPGASGLTVKDEGSALATDATSLDFVGPGVTASGTGAAKTITIPGGSSAPYLDTYSLPLDATMGDDFDGASLNGRWTRVNISSGWETYQAGGGSVLRVAMGSATTIQQYEQALPAGDGEYKVSFSVLGGGTRMYGINFVTAAGAGRGICFYNDAFAYFSVLSGFTYSTNSAQMGNAYNFMSGQVVYAKIRRSGTSIYACISGDGYTWGKEWVVTDSTAYTHIRIGRFYGGTADEVFSVYQFDRVA